MEIGEILYDTFLAYGLSYGGWPNEAYRTVTFNRQLDLTTPLGQWFSANAAKQ